MVVLGVAAIAAVVLPLSTGQLKYPGWFAVQRVDAILAPAAVGWYWARRRPGARFAWLLVLLGVLAVPLVLEASSSPWLRLIGVLAEAPLLFVTFVVVLAFPSGRFSPFKRVLFAPLALTAVAYVPYTLLTARTVGGPITACAGLCPHNPLQIAASTGLLTAFAHVYDGLGVLAATGAAVALAIDLRRADPLRRRALLIASGAALMFLVAFAIYAAAGLFAPPPSSAVNLPIRWVLPISRALLPFGYLAALIDAQLYAGRLVTGIVERALRSSSTADVVRTLPRALGDPDLTIGFWVDGRGWLHADGTPLAEPARASGRVMTTIQREGRPLAAVVHRAQLEESPELIDAIVAASLLIAENATLEAELHSAMGQLRESRARIITAGDAERRRIERDLHDGAQQRLIALRMKLASSGEAAAGDGTDRGQLVELCSDVDRVLAEIRQLAHGIFPALLADRGLMAALEAAARDSPLSVRVASAVAPQRRYPLDLEAALYFCGVEALQNASKHAGADARVTITVAETQGELSICVRDDGVGFDARGRHLGTGLAGMLDRVGAFGGHLAIESVPGGGTAVRAGVPLAADGAIGRGRPVSQPVVPLATAADAAGRVRASQPRR